ncbi:glycoside hydrolase [Gramella aestuarii]|uniref:Glycoside hydrolase n=2 Tax=Christiangramia aestuarii TaxID=1028746 RepID=A0A7K1LNH6_9FLAO|nr:glycoside hydrolase [Christiangramia aestuarii]
MNGSFSNKTIKIFAFAIAILFCSCQAEVPSRKYNGISLVASRDSLETGQLEPIIKVNANAVALMPYAFLRSTEEPELIYNIDRQWFGERLEGIEQAISVLRRKELKIMIKPHIWIMNGKFTGDLDFKTGADWERFEASYREYILLYAGIAEKHQIELLCIGTELYNFLDKRPEFWNSFISEVRELFQGKITYAENWDKIDKTDIWSHLDLIGVDAYYPLHQEASPTKEEIRSGWEKHKPELKSLASEYHKPILFTEYGYRNIDHAVKEPWNSDRDHTGINHELQAFALEVIYEEFWPETWFSGGFLWKWHQQESAGGLENDRFTPQNKPAEEVVRDYYGRFRN